jgi:hypothetical protein
MSHNYITDLTARDYEEVIWSNFYKSVLADARLKVSRVYVWDYQADKSVSLENFENKAHSVYQTDDYISAWFVESNAVYLVQQLQAKVTIWVQAVTIEKADAIKKYWLERFIKSEDEAGDDKVWINFWSKAQSGPTYFRRKIDAPIWDEIKINYSGTTMAELEKLHQMQFDEARSGKLILWYGEAGTGKTHAIRSLAKEWVSWCATSYFVYPEFFFNDPDYMLQVILNNDHSERRWDHEQEDWVTPKKWHLLVFEDAGELLYKDAKERQGQALSRLLNLADGMIGQGLRVLVLITTNEKISSFHDAVSREGRVSSLVDFKKLNHDEADRWAEANGYTLQDKNGKNGMYTLAELYNDSVPGRLEPQKIGFH